MNSKTKYFFSFLIFLFIITGCKQDKTTTQNNISEPLSPATTTSASDEETIQEEATKNEQNNSQEQIAFYLPTSYECPSTLESEQNFTDTFVKNQNPNIIWKVVLNKPLQPREIEAIFNKAHLYDDTIHIPLRLPPQNIWEEMNEAEKFLYLLNQERCARNLRPFEGIDPYISTSVSQPYATYISSHIAQFDQSPHHADERTAQERMREDGNLLEEKNVDNSLIGEVITMMGVGSSEEYLQVYDSSTKSLYACLYEDAQKDYGHRKVLLSTNLKENSGVLHQEGLLGIGIATAQTIQNNIYWTKVYTVVDCFDPNKKWDENLSHTIRVKLFH